MKNHYHSSGENGSWKQIFTPSLTLASEYLIDSLSCSSKVFAPILINGIKNPEENWLTHVNHGTLCTSSNIIKYRSLKDLCHKKQ